MLLIFALAHDCKCAHARTLLHSSTHTYMYMRMSYDGAHGLADSYLWVYLFALLRDFNSHIYIRLLAGVCARVE